MIKIKDLNREDFIEFVTEIVEQDDLNFALKAVYDNMPLGFCLSFIRTKRGFDYWDNRYYNGYNTTLTKEEIEDKLNMERGTLIIKK
jgi:hypothetical protein